MQPSAVRERAADLPSKPGVYLFESADSGGSGSEGAHGNGRNGPEEVPGAGRDGAGGGSAAASDGTVLYVGKAVDLRDRVRSYGDPRTARIRQMLRSADRVDVSVTETETQALLLEANLVKRFQPRYNVRLKDDKSYPLVQLTDHEFPRIEITRDPADGATVYGPFTNVGRVETVVKALRETFGVRGCSDHKFSGRERPCLDYEVGLCTAPCTGEIGEADYLADVDSVRRFLEGEAGVLATPMRRGMEAAADRAEFERAANLRDRLREVEAFHEGGGEAVHAREERSVDVLGVAIEGRDATVARLHSEDGKLVDRERHGLAAPDSEHKVAELLSAFVPQYYAERELPDALLLSERPGDDEVVDWLEREGVAVRVPGAGREATLVDLALKNARRQVGRRDESAELAHELGLDRARRIEGFDVSHAQGRAVVGSNVCFVEGDAAKRGYRRKKLTDRNDDYANMRQLVRWRARRAVEGRDDRPDPDLLLIDGGEGQLAAARDALAEAGWDVPVVALAKEAERVVAPDRVYDWPSDAGHLHLLQRVRDEAHRFAVQYHQQVRDTVDTALDDVAGVGPELRKRLLRRFGSVDGVRAASAEELRSVDGVGASTAESIRTQL